MPIPAIGNGKRGNSQKWEKSGDICGIGMPLWCAKVEYSGKIAKIFIIFDNNKIFFPKLRVGTGFSGQNGRKSAKMAAQKLGSQNEHAKMAGGRLTRRPNHYF